ncbi:hypothetical protein [Rhodococcus sp. RS1C4]|nr:hypothetical protein [Rhodococcus sp. RS1C4]
MKHQKPYVQRRWLGEWAWVAWRPRGGGEFAFFRWEDAMACALGQPYPSKENAA